MERLPQVKLSIKPSVLPQKLKFHHRDITKEQTNLTEDEETEIGTKTEPHLNSELVNQFCSVFVFTEIEWAYEPNHR